MKLLLWPLAVVLAVVWLIAWRLGRREPQILRGALSPRLIRMVVITLVMLGAGKKTEAQTQPAKPAESEIEIGNSRPLNITVQGRPVIPDDAGGMLRRSNAFPAELTEDDAQRWAADVANGRNWSALSAHIASLHELGGAANTAKPALLAGAAPLALLLKSEADSATAYTLKDISDAARALAAEGYYHPWPIAYLWRKAATARDASDTEGLATVFSLLEDMARADNALRLANARAPINMSGWMSKSATPILRANVPKDFLAVARDQYPLTDAGLWETEAVLTFQLPKDIPIVKLIRRGQVVQLKPGEFVRLRRFDILDVGRAEGPLTVTHRTLGTLKIPNSFSLTAFRAPVLADEPVQKRIDEWTTAALAGDDDALNLLEMTLPIAAPTLRDTLAKRPTQKGAPALRMLMQQYDGE